MGRKLITTLAVGALLATGAAQADPPPWAGNGNKQNGKPHKVEKRIEYHNDRDWRDYRFSRDERDRLGRFYQRYPSHSDLPPGLRKKLARTGELPPGWRKKLQSGHRLSDDLRRFGYRLPNSYYGDGYRGGYGYSDYVIDNEVVRVLDATQTIIDIFQLTR